ncbi:MULTISPECIES: hypothetical protein [Aurantimonas]|uniref:hypothetical protein n=1 Tax=Aurantimonas TaxID=182269 RepID=UPI00351769B6
MADATLVCLWLAAIPLLLLTSVQMATASISAAMFGDRILVICLLFMSIMTSWCGFAMMRDLASYLVG